MATSDIHTNCSKCEEKEDLYDCRSCSQTFCFEHLEDHRKIIRTQVNQLEDNLNSFRQKLNDQKNHSNNHPLVEKINQWKNHAFEMIELTAKDCIEKLMKYINKFFNEIEHQFNDLTTKLEESSTKNRLKEIYLNKLKKKLTELEELLNKSVNISIKEESTTFIDKISVITSVTKGNNERI